MVLDEFSRSVLVMVGTGAASCTIVAILWRVHVGRSNHRRIFALSRDAHGGSYLLPVAFMVPFLTLFLAMVIELSLLVHTRMTAQSAVIAAAQAAMVYLPTEERNTPSSPDYLTPDERMDKLRWAAAKTMWPAASGATKHTPITESLNPNYSTVAIAGFERFGKTHFDQAYLNRKLNYAFHASKIEVKKLAASSEIGSNPVEVTLHYEIPFHTPGVGRLFGRKSNQGDFYVTSLKAKICIDQEVPRSKNGSLGIRYYERTSPTAN